MTASPTPFHAVSNLVKRLESADFKLINERTFQPDSLKSGGKYYYTRNQSSLVAFILPTQPSASSAVSFAVGHLDSCCPKVRPVSKQTKDGYLQVGVELYGGGIWASWFDRDLSLAGRVIVNNNSSTSKNGQSHGSSYTSKLVKIDRPLLRIPTLAIHLDRTINEAFKFNKETQWKPILGLVSEQLNASAPGSGDAQSATPLQSGRNTPKIEEREDDVAGMSNKHHPMMLAVLADELGCDVADIQDFEL